MAKFALFGFGVADSFKITVNKEEHTVDFVNIDKYAELDKYQGVILNKNTVEKFKGSNGINDFTFDNALLLALEKIFNATFSKKDIWWCFLVERLHSKANSRKYGTNISIPDTDTLKRIIRPYRISYKTGAGINHLKGIAPEFKPYFEKLYAIAHTVFTKTIDTPEECPIVSIASTSTNKSNMVGFEVFNSKVFCLPFFRETFNSDNEGYIDLSTTIIKCIKEYKSKRSFEVPEAIKTSFIFEQERVLEDRKSELETELEETSIKLNLFNQHKAITTLNGDSLHELVASIMKGFWGLNIFIQDECPETAEKVEDIKILSNNDESETLALVEVKGVNSGVKLEHINQVSTHRERNELPQELAGVLIINTLINKTLEERLSVSIAENVNQHALRNNVFVITTLDLLQLMLDYETKPLEERKAFILDLFLTNKGLFQKEVNNTTA